MSIRALPQGSRVIFQSDDPDDVFHLLADGCAVIVNPRKAARIVDTSGEVRLLDPNEALDLGAEDFSNPLPVYNVRQDD